MPGIEYRIKAQKQIEEELVNKNDINSMEGAILYRAGILEERVSLLI